jgi:TatD DNase family protein
VIDAHCHIHEADFPFPWLEILNNARSSGVDQMITVGTSVRDSLIAAEFAAEHPEVFALVGIHPEGKIDGGAADLAKIIKNHPKVVGLGDVGLDYHYQKNRNSPETQKQLLREMLELAVEHDLPISFHIRDAFTDFWPIFDEFDGRVKGVLHCFTDSKENLTAALERGLFIGVNGVVTFAKDVEEVIQLCPLERVILETDAPWLAPASLRGQQNQPANVLEVAKFLAKMYNVEVSEVERITSENTKKLFKL